MIGKSNAAPKQILDLLFRIVTLIEKITKIDPIRADKIAYGDKDLKKLKKSRVFFFNLILSLQLHYP